MKNLQKLRNYMELGPALFFSLMAVYCISVYLIETYAASEIAWALFLKLTTSLRHVLYLMEDKFAFNIHQNMILFVFLGLFGFMSTFRQLRYFRFFYFHSALLFVVFAMMSDISSDIATNSIPTGVGGLSVTQIVNLEIIYFYICRLEGVKLFLFVSILLACTSWHISQLSRFVRKTG